MCEITIERYCMKKKLGLLAGVILLTLCLLPSGKSDDWLRSRTVRIADAQDASCSGEQVRAPSGQDYILTAGHCASLAKDGTVIVITEDGRKLQRRIIEEDPNSDLLLIEGLPNLEGMSIARSHEKREHVRTFTHGSRLDTYRTEGVYIQEQHIDVPLYIITDQHPESGCNMAKNKILDVQFFIFEMKFCAISVSEEVSTAFIVPGSSGGMVVNDSGELVGVVSATDTKFGFFVRLYDIHQFIKNY